MRGIVYFMGALEEEATKSSAGSAREARTKARVESSCAHRVDLSANGLHPAMVQ